MRNEMNNGRNEMTDGEFSGAENAGHPLGDADAPTSKNVGLRASILAGVTLGVAAVGLAASDISTVVSVHAA